MSNKIKNRIHQVQDELAVISRYTTYTQEELIQHIQTQVNTVPEDQRASIIFELDVETYEYDDREYPILFMRWMRPENEKETAERLALEEYYKKRAEEHDAREFQRLQGMFNPDGTRKV